MAPLKASTEDGYLALIFQKYLGIVGREVEEYCLEILNGQRDITKVNCAHIVLIPKKNPLQI